MTLERIPLAGVIGSPIAHSKSPQLHHHWLRTYGLKGHYIPMDIGTDDLRDVLEMLPRMGFVGVNITVPHKERVLEMADLITDRATLIGAANTLIFRKDGKIHADNTDGYGFIENLRQGAPDWTAKAGPAAVLGAGGAARVAVEHQPKVVELGIGRGDLCQHRVRISALSRDHLCERHGAGPDRQEVRHGVLLWIHGLEFRRRPFDRNVRRRDLPRCPRRLSEPAPAGSTEHRNKQLPLHCVDHPAELHQPGADRGIVHLTEITGE